MEIKIVSIKENPLLKRKEVSFTMVHASKEKTPERQAARKAVAIEMKVGDEVVFIKKMNTKTGTNITQGIANVYQKVADAQVIEPEYIKKRNNPKPKEETA
jgi:ribosomal protein S24E